jgi:hypothetical protein
MTTILVIVCAWCKKKMGTKDGQGISGVTHSICPEYSKRETEEFRKEVIYQIRFVIK